MADELRIRWKPAKQGVVPGQQTQVAPGAATPISWATPKAGAAPRSSSNSRAVEDRGRVVVTIFPMAERAHLHQRPVGQVLTSGSASAAARSNARWRAAMCASSGGPSDPGEATMAGCRGVAPLRLRGRRPRRRSRSAPATPDAWSGRPATTTGRPRRRRRARQPGDHPAAMSTRMTPSPSRTSSRCGSPRARRPDRARPAAGSRSPARRARTRCRR